MSKVGGERNFGYGKTLAWAGKNALRGRYGDGHFATQAAHAARWKRFAVFAKRAGIKDARAVSREVILAYAAELASQVQANEISVRYAQNLLSTVNVVLDAMGGDRGLRVAPASLVGRRRDVRRQRPVSLNRSLLTGRLMILRKRGQHRVAAVAELARELGLRFREASLLDARQALREAQRSGRVNVTRGTKGGRGNVSKRSVPVTPRAMASLERSAAIQSDGENLIPAGMSFRAWRDHAYGVWRRTAQRGAPLSGFHDLRVAYACERYEVLTGKPAPVAAGERLADRDADRAARALIGQELGHGRLDVLAAYLGARR